MSTPQYTMAEPIKAFSRYPSLFQAESSPAHVISRTDLENGKYALEWIGDSKTSRFYADFDYDATHLSQERFDACRIQANLAFRKLYNDKEYVYTDGSYSTEEKKKLSFHLINKNIMIDKTAFRWDTEYGKKLEAEILENFSDDIRPVFASALDNAVYSNKTFRLPYGKLEDKPNVHVPKIDCPIEDYFVSVCSGVLDPLMRQQSVKVSKEKAEKVQAVEMKSAFIDEPEVEITDERKKSMMEMLNVVKLDRFASYPQWHKLLCLMKYNGLSLTEFQRMSRESGYSSFDADECAKKWFEDKDPQRPGFPTIHKWLEEDGVDWKTMFCPKTKSIVGSMLQKIFETGTLTHSDVAEIFFEEKKQDIYNTQMGWLVFDEVKGWTLGTEQLILLPFIRTCGHGLSKYVSSLKDDSDEEKKKKAMLRKIANKILDYGYMTKAIKIMGELFKNTEVIKEFDCHPELFAFSNLKAWDLVKGKSVDITKHHKIFTTCGYPMPERVEEEVKAAREFVLTYQDESTIDSFLSMCACSFYGKNKNQVIFIHTGVGGNGKSVHGDLMSKTLGNYAGLLPIEQFTIEAKSRSEANSSLAALLGKRYARSNEPEDDGNQKLKISRIKQITGDEEIDVRELYGKTFPMSIKFTPHILANDIPSLSKQDGGIARRIKVVRYPYTFKDEPNPEDPTQRQKILEINLEQYKNGFFYLCADAWRKTNGVYLEANEVKEDVEEYLRENNPLIPFLTGFESSDKFIRQKDLHELFNEWCDRQKIERYKNKAFGTILETAIMADGSKVKIEKDPKNGNKVFIKQKSQ